MPPKKGASKAKVVAAANPSPQPTPAAKSPSVSIFVTQPRRSSTKADKLDSPMPAVKLEPKSTERKPEQAFNKYFNVGEDQAILSVYKPLKSKKNLPMEKIVQEISLKLPKRTSEEIAYRINLYLSKLAKAEEEKIMKCVRVYLNPDRP
jgi:hypothetical protein